VFLPRWLKPRLRKAKPPFGGPCPPSSTGGQRLAWLLVGAQRAVFLPPVAGDPSPNYPVVREPAGGQVARPQNLPTGPGGGRIQGILWRFGMSALDDKVNGRVLGWQWLRTTYPYTHPMFRVREDQVRWPDGHVAPYVYIEAVEAVWVVPITSDGSVVLIRQFRYVVDDWCWEVPAGGFHDFEGSPIELAKRELAEEVGGESDDWTYVGSFRPGMSITDQICHIVLARDVRLSRQPHREAGEIIEVHPTPISRALEMARNGEIVDGHSALALLRCEPWLREGVL